MKITNLNWEIGSHLPFSGSISKTIKHSLSLGAYTVQFFLGSPKSFNRARISEYDIQETKKLIDRFPTIVIAHSPYIFNWAGTVKDLAWSGNAKLDYSMEYKLSELEYEVNMISNFKNGGVVVHPGCHINRLDGCIAIGKSLSKINFNKGARILLENSAGEGNKLGNTFQELKIMYDNVIKSKQQFIEFCIDTAHIFGNGEYNLTNGGEVIRMFKEFDDIIGLDKLGLIHLNDSCVCFGSKKDRHIMIGEGYIFGESYDSLLILLDFAKAHSIPMVLETIPEDLLTIDWIGNK